MNTRRLEIRERWRKTRCFLLVGVVVFLELVGAAATSLRSLEYQLTKAELRISPALLSLPKGVQGSVMVEVVAGGGNEELVRQLTEGTYVEATLRGPSFEARRLVGAPNSALLLPPLNLVGDSNCMDQRASGDQPTNPCPTNLLPHWSGRRRS